MSGMGGVSCNLACTPQGPGGVQILETWEVATNHLLSRVNDTLQSGLVPGCGSSGPDGDGGGEDGLSSCIWTETFHLEFRYKNCFILHSHMSQGP